MRKTLTFLVAITLPLAGLCASIFWDAGSISGTGVLGTGRYSWDLEIVEDVYIGFSFDIAMSGTRLVISPVYANYLEAETWVKRCNSEDLITKDSIEQDFFLASSSSIGLAAGSSFPASKNGYCTFGYAVCFYNTVWVYGWVSLKFRNGTPYPNDGCYVIGADGIYAGTSRYISGPQIVECPEPTAAALLALGIVALSLRRGQRVA